MLQYMPKGIQELCQDASLDTRLAKQISGLVEHASVAILVEMNRPEGEISP